MPIRPPWGRIPHDLGNRNPWLRVPFPESEYEGRWTRIAEKLRAQGLEALIAMGGPGDSGAVRYLTNFESYVGNTAVVISAKGECAMATNSLMRAEPMQSSIWMSHVRDVRITAPKRYQPDARPLDALIVDILNDYGLGVGNLGIAGTIGASFAEAPPEGEGAPAFHDFSDALAEVMSLKSAAEIAVIRRANLLVSDVFASVREGLRVGVTEAQLAGVAFETMMAGGAEGASFPLALVGGSRSGLKHVLPTNYALQSGDLLFIDFGLILDGYATDNARTAIVGTPSREARTFLEAADAMTKAAVAVAAPGIGQNVLDDVAFEIACDRGFQADYYFRAHGVGTTLFQPPRFNPGCGRALKLNDVFSLEPMLVRHGYGSACVERTVLVSETGAEVLDPGMGIWIDERG